MPAVSKAQQQFFAIMEHNPSLAKARGLHMTKQQMHDFAATKSKNLPKHKSTLERMKSHADKMRGR